MEGRAGKGGSMKQPKKLTRSQKIMLSEQGIDPKELALVRDLPNSQIFVNKSTGETVVIEK